MDHEVHDDEPPCWRGVLAEGVPAVDEDRDVVIPVQEYQLLLPQHDKYRVTQLRNLRTRFYGGTILLMGLLNIPLTGQTSKSRIR